jgi:hypothetical protein
MAAGAATWPGQMQQLVADAPHLTLAEETLHFFPKHQSLGELVSLYA